MSLEALRQVVAEFAPVVVHLICHGRELEGGGVQLELWDAARNAPAFVGEAELVAALVGGDGSGGRRAPALVVLSACSSGDRVLAPEDGGLARALIAAGVQVVVGTGAAVRDQACRRVTRGLGDAIAGRAPILIAAATGRRIALAGDGAAGFDWALVQTLFGDDMPPDLGARPAPPGSDQALMRGWLAGSKLELDLPDAPHRTYPPLCGAVEAIERFYELLHGPHAALALIARPPREGARVGKRRVLSELAAIAIRGGHVPVTLIASRTKGPPRTPAALGRELGRAFKDAWTRHGLGKPTSAAVAGLDLPDDDDDDATGGRTGYDYEDIAGELADALAADCAALRDAARARYPLIARVPGQVVLMLHDVHAWGDAAPVVLELVRARGANLRAAAPLVFTWRQTPPGARDTSHQQLDHDLTTLLGEARSLLRAVDLLPLAPIDPRRPDLGLDTIPLAARLALQRVLLNPFRREPDFAARRWLLELGCDRPEQRETLRTLVAFTRGCCPGQFDDDDFLTALTQVMTRLTPADDDDALRHGGAPP